MEFIDLFLKEALIPIYAITLIVAIYKYPKYFDSTLKYFPILLMYTFLNELLGYLILNDSIGNIFLTGAYSNYNYFIYNIYNIVFFIYFALIFRTIIEDSLKKKVILYGIIFFLIISILNIIYQDPLKKSLLWSYVSGGLLMIISVILFYRNKLNKLKSFSIKKNAFFWIGLGIGLFFIGYIPIKIKYTFLTSVDSELFYKLKRIHFSLIYFMYGCFIYGFAQMKGKLKV